MKTTLHIQSPQTKEFLQTPWIKEDGAYTSRLPVSIKDDKVTFEITNMSFIHYSSPIKKWFVALRAISLTVMIIPCLAILIFGLVNDWQFSIFDAVAAMIIPSLLLLAVNVLNDVQDHFRLIDLPGTNGGSGVIQKGWISPRELSRFAYVLIFLSASLAIPIISKNSQMMILFGTITLMSVLGYSGKPFNLKYKAMGDVVVFLMCGPFLTLCYSFAVFGRSSVDVNLLGCFFGFLATAILHANNLNDINVDKSRGAVTVANLLGFEMSKRYFYSLYFLSLVVMIILTIKTNLPWMAISPFIIILYPLCRLFIKVARAKSPDDESIKNIRFITPQIHLFLGVLVCAVLLVLNSST